MKGRRPDSFVTLTRLRDSFAFSPKWIERLGPPDKEARNPHYASAAPMKLYRVERILAFIAENRADYEKRLRDREKRSAVAKGVAGERAARETARNAERAERAEAWAQQVPIRTHKPPPDMWNAATLHFAERDAGCTMVNDRGVVAYLRHQHTNYDELLHDMAMRFEVRTWRELGALAGAASVLRDRVNQAVCGRAGFAWNNGMAEDGRPW